MVFCKLTGSCKADGAGPRLGTSVLVGGAAGADLNMLL